MEEKIKELRAAIEQASADVTDKARQESPEAADVVKAQA